MASNWIMGDVLRVLHEKKMEIPEFPIEPDRLGKLLRLIHNRTISHTVARSVFDEMLIGCFGCDHGIDVSCFSIPMLIRQFFGKPGYVFPEDEEDYQAALPPM